MAAARCISVKFRFVALGLAALIIGACTGGTGKDGIGVVSGIVSDADGNVVRNARVYWVGDSGTQSTYTNSAGAYTLEKITEGIPHIRAEISKGGVLYYGENYMDVFANERSKSLNIIIARQDQLARFKGTVWDSSGTPLQNARIYMNANGLGSLLGMTNDKGDFNFPKVVPNVTYEVYATGRGYDSDRVTLTFSAGQTRTVDFTLTNGSNPTLTPPQNLWAVAWTSPRVSTTGARPQTGNVKGVLSQILDKKLTGTSRKPQFQSKNSAGGNWIEVDLYWDTMRSDSLLGYGIYRGTSASGATTGIELVRDPLTYFFADSDQSLTEGRNYYYEITALNVLYPDTDQSESNFSNRYGVRTLGDLTLRSALTSPVTFRWNHANGATEYTTFVFYNYPDLGETAFWPTDGNTAEWNAATTTSNELVYAGPALTRGHRYYYVVLGHANSLDSRTISEIGSFVAP